MAGKKGSLQADFLGAGADMPYPPELSVLRNEVLTCTRCPLHCSRIQAVFGEGRPDAKLMFIGEAPGAQEDESGRPFIGRSGQFLTRAMEAHGLERSQVFISNVVKCRPPENRDPLPEEIRACNSYLMRQIDLIKPKLLCALGRYAASVLLDRDIKITKDHGHWFEYHGTPLMIAMHPSAAMRSVMFRQQFDADLEELSARFRALPG